MIPYKLPQHLEKYVVNQNYEKYTPEDQAIWRFALKKLKEFLSSHAHPCYLEGLTKTGISLEKIPRIEEISKKLESFGWQAVPVSGFIPPAAFMEFQSRGFLPIASEIRTLEHLLYTPAPDIIHEAAGHAPILIDPNFANYLKQYAQIANKAIINTSDQNQYSLIRKLSDLKEDPGSNPDDIQKLELEIDKINKNNLKLSEASYLSRMNWWTAEYGLIGELNDPKIFGAGLLSSIGESRSCLKKDVKKIPLSLDCLEYGYDITKPQPQLFVTPNFEKLTMTLEELAKRMSFHIGGAHGLEQAKISGTVCTIELDSGVQISGILNQYLKNSLNDIEFIKLLGPTQLSLESKELLGHDKFYHKDGYSSPLGPIKIINKSLSQCSKSEIERLNLIPGKFINLNFRSGFCLQGTVHSLTFNLENLIIVQLQKATLTRGNEIFFKPEWGNFDLVCGDKISSVFGGAADRIKYGEFTDDFSIEHVSSKKYSDKKRIEFEIFNSLNSFQNSSLNIQEINTLLEKYKLLNSKNWLLIYDLLQISNPIPELILEKKFLKEQLTVATPSGELKDLLT
jgi:phenylalanine-4-hydroxylase